MFGKNRRFAVMAAIAVLMVFCFGVHHNIAFISQNGAGTGYEEDDDPPEGTGSYRNSSTIENYIELGAGYYLKAREDVDLLLKMMENQGSQSPSISEIQAVVNRAIENILLAGDTYNALVRKAEATPYNMVVIDQLNQFDYAGFREGNGLNPAVFDRVERFLKGGDITGMFRFTAEVYVEFAVALELIKAGLEKNSSTDVAALWTLNESFSETSLFGSYVARVFYEIQ